jgi:sugar phosphate isomerase/epimerase
MTLEECFEEMNSIGAHGLEMMGQATVRDYPYPSTEWINNYWSLIEKYNIVPWTYTNFHDKYIRKVGMSVDENVAYQTREFELGKKLGFRHYRLLIGFPVNVLEKMIPIAEKMGVWMGIELHAPVPLNCFLVETVLALAEKHPEAVGFVPDWGIFAKYPSELERNKQVEAGTLTLETAEYILDAYKKGTDKEAVAAQVKRMKPKAGDAAYVDRVYSAGASYQDPQDLVRLLPYCKSTHGKCHYITEGNEFRDTEAEWEPGLRVMMENGYDGYINTEFEGQRSFSMYDIDELDQVRRVHVIMKRILGV